MVVIEVVRPTDGCCRIRSQVLRGRGAGKVDIEAPGGYVVFGISTDGDVVGFSNLQN